MNFFSKKCSLLNFMANIKEKILSFGQNCGLSKTEIAHRLGISKSNFVGDSMKSDIGSGILERFCKEFPTVSTEWLLRDRGPMIIELSAQIPETNVNNGVNNGHIGSGDHLDERPVNTPDHSNRCDSCALITAKDQVIQAQQTTISSQQHTIELLIKR